MVTWMCHMAPAAPQCLLQALQPWDKHKSSPLGLPNTRCREEVTRSLENLKIIYLLLSLFLICFSSIGYIRKVVPALWSSSCFLGNRAGWRHRERSLQTELPSKHFPHPHGSCGARSVWKAHFLFSSRLEPSCLPDDG